MKVNGVLVHPAEVERALVALPGVREGAVLAESTADGSTRLVAYATPLPGDEVHGWALRRDLATRLASGLTYRVAALTDEEKRAALVAHAHTRGFELGDEVASYLLTHARRDMGSLMSALDAIDQYSLETRKPVTVPLLKAAMQR